MALFRWRFGARKSATSTTAGSTSQDDSSNLPPSYEESQDASLRAVLRGARAVAPLLWPSGAFSYSATADSPPLSPSSLGYTWCPDAAGEDKEKQPAKSAIACASAEEDAMMEVLENLAMAPCGDYPFLDRIREFSDFYFMPYSASEESAILSSPSPSPEKKKEKEKEKEKDIGGNSSATRPRGTPLREEAVPVQERHRKVLEGLGVPYESAALVLCARVLEDYYAGLGNVDWEADIDIAQEPLAPYPQFSEAEEGKEKEKATTSSSSSSSAEMPKGRNEQSPTPPPTPTAHPTTKTKLSQIASCLEQDCICTDYDHDYTPTPNPTPPFPRCGCGHPRSSHKSSAQGISRLLRRYTNWDSEAYSALRHRSSKGKRKRRIHDIKACGAAGGTCPCRDYDKGRRTGRCARCGHYYQAHCLVDTRLARGPDERRGPQQQQQQQQQQQEEDSEKGKGKEKEKGEQTGGSGTMEYSDSKNKEWELSWILIENAYLLLNHVTPISRRT
ncbi:hypothetical protein F4859DRAFT_204131 [Xylaria cf. heliscus]|nr:hypothetical protein F4859DRAFT_204131 [Xylaria cf. heliscus]